MCNREIIVVSSGEYSDYKVWAAFDDEKKAEQYRDQLALVEYHTMVETLPLNPDPPEIVLSIEVWMDRHGNTEPLRPAWHLRVSRLGFVTYNYGSYEKQGDQVLVWSVHTEDPEHAIKVVNEVRIQLIAAGAWGSSGKTRDWIWIEARVRQ